VTDDNNVSEEITNHHTVANRSHFGLKSQFQVTGRQKFLYIKHLCGHYLHTPQKPGPRQKLMKED